eukprot:INCI7660.1.p1 GENE.INCI7660.1~~INCI7660.1.p1  ORF type:complete len:323 (-),score=66.53 INCI7660.1:586-1455(-)
MATSPSARKGSNASEDGLTALERSKRAVEKQTKKRAEWAKKILARRIEDFKESPEGHLLLAAEKNRTEELLVALKRDPDLNFATDGTHEFPGYTAMHFAAHHGNIEMVVALLMCGANLGVYEKFGYTPLHLCVISEQRAMVELLIESGADLELTNNHGYTALHSAVHYGRSEIVAILLQSGADVTAVTYDSQASALHLAVYAQNADCVAQILNAKIDPNLRNYEDYTALHIAFWNQHKEIQQLIIDAGGLLQTESTFAYEEYEPEPEPEIEIGDVDNIADFAKFFSKKK